jgi:hypothetical protein
VLLQKCTAYIGCAALTGVVMNRNFFWDIRQHRTLHAQSFADNFFADVTFRIREIPSLGSIPIETSLRKNRYCPNAIEWRSNRAGILQQAYLSVAPNWTSDISLKWILLQILLLGQFQGILRKCKLNVIFKQLRKAAQGYAGTAGSYDKYIKSFNDLLSKTGLVFYHSPIFNVVYN